MHILLILIKNSSVFDYALPVLHRIREEYPQARISIFCAALNQAQIIRPCQFMDDILKDDRIEMLDLTSFLDHCPGFVKSWIRWLFRFTNWDRSLTHRWLKTIRIGFIRQMFNGLRSYLSKTLTNKISGVEILERLKPTLVIYDHRSNSLNYGKIVGEFHQYLDKAQIPVILSPHAPHQIDLDQFVPFCEEGTGLPAYTEYWMPFIHDEHWRSIPETKPQMQYIGYPGMDSKWLDYCKPRGAVIHRTKSAPNELTCLFVIRRFLNKGEPDWPDFDDHFIFNYNEFLEISQHVAKALRQLSRPVHLLIKPHPSNDFGRVEELMRQVNMPSYSITTEPMFGVLNQIDLVVSIYSTIFFVPSVMGIPIALLNTRVQRNVHARNDAMKNLYEGFEYYVPEYNQLTGIMQRMINRLDGPAIPLADDPDVQHMRRFYPDGAADRALDRITRLQSPDVIARKESCEGVRL